MRIGLSGGAASVDRMVSQAQEAEAEGFSSLWYASGVAGDPLVAMAMAGRATESIELGTAVLQTYPCHPLLQANRVIAAANAMGRPGLCLGLGPSHEPIVRDVLGLSYDHPARNTADYLRIISPLLRGGDVDVDGIDWSAHTVGRGARPDRPVPLLLSALSPRMLRIAAQFADGVVLWMASRQALESRITPILTAATAEFGRPGPRIVAGLPVAVHDDTDEARHAVAATAVSYAGMRNYEQIIRAGGGTSAADVAIVGTESEVRHQLQALLDAGATDIWAQPVAVGTDRAERSTSMRRTRALLRTLAREG
ncbi:LLM class F420-dependent oxidoreductase [Mycolicibacterium conceptionense]|uniref:LLM class F420-dependent oxidoreductase n=1 Tax=Mycolicibacterium conceptionense TaxID=451644 RepID=A0A1A1WPC1_9MYCO|nr:MULTISPECIES: TIGR03564 family F420-dependent LLM class oxidoreductase [Mycolicibacterium]MCW1822606.1 TIGR03564 family F420-dependent LLM class oxidoreductase [Mycolicibacterium senegalense]OBB11543.1 LLM class F420-dependent oxidoreductase [Mycolicibacterium conceptionense]OBF08654.1 LLM class F420-dependent oxidoreductase [Mycolicibacterium conceptionense]OBF12891.1 LLM class F420-dependent oxidoreductase [Mycolicibacterium conceptionense]OBF45407.1 LLM class F420-dependent oxidoreductas